MLIELCRCHDFSAPICCELAELIAMPLELTTERALFRCNRHCATLPPCPHPLIPGCGASRAQSEPSLASRPMGVIIEFEGSGSWPSDDMLALRAIKGAMLLRLSQTLKTKFNTSSSCTIEYASLNTA